MGDCCNKIRLDPGFTFFYVTDFLVPVTDLTCDVSFIHSFIHVEHLYSAPSKKTTQRRSQLQCGYRNNRLQTREERER